MCKALVIAAVLAVSSASWAQIRVGCWNLTEYGGQANRTQPFQTAIFGEFQGRSFAPDVLVAQEIETVTANNTFAILVLDDPLVGPGDYETAQFQIGPGGSSSGVFYRSSKLELLESVAAGSGTRLFMRYRFRLKGFDPGPENEFYLFSVHLKAGNTETDRDRRLTEAVQLRDLFEALPVPTPTPPLYAGPPMAILAGDLNVYFSAEPAYTHLTEVDPVDNAGQLFDPIKTPGSWNNNGSFRFVHTQSPDGGSGGLDDRFDQILLNAPLIDGVGMDYVGNPNLPYSTSTWNDPNHSYRVWGNDGSFFNGSISLNNSMVGSDIAFALATHASGLFGPHLPLFLDLYVPAKISAPASVDFGTVEEGQPAIQTINIGNGTDLLFSRDGSGDGIRDLEYTLAIQGTGFTIVGGTGPFTDAPGGADNSHQIQMDTSTRGTTPAASLVITSPTQEVIVPLSGSVIAPSCQADTNGDNLTSVGDILNFLSFWQLQDPGGDWNNDGAFAVGDILDYLAAWSAGCP